MQTPVFREAGLDLSDCWPGTINLSFAPLELRLKRPDHCFQHLHWTDLHPPETFSFWRVVLITEPGQRACGWIYLPHPETKQRHWQSSSTLEVLAPFLEGLAPNSRVEVVDDRSRIALVDGVRLGPPAGISQIQGAGGATDLLLLHGTRSTACVAQTGLA